MFTNFLTFYIHNIVDIYILTKLYKKYIHQVLLKNIKQAKIKTVSFGKQIENNKLVHINFKICVIHKCNLKIPRKYMC